VHDVKRVLISLNWKFISALHPSTTSALQVIPENSSLS
jgi:hypothetical protein